MRKDISDENINLYKWIKIIEYIVLIVLGLILAITGYFSDGVDDAMSYAVGVVLIVFGTMNIISGYLLYRSALTQDIAIGTIAIGFAVVLFFNPDLLQNIISIFLITCMYVISVMLIINGLDNLGVFRGGQKKIRLSVLEFIASACLIALSSVYLYFYMTDIEFIQGIMIIIVGALLVITGIFCLVNLLKKIRNTNEILYEQEAKVEETYNTSDQVVTTDVKVVDINDLKKEENRKQSHSKRSAIKNSSSETVSIADSKKDEGE